MSTTQFQQKSALENFNWYQRYPIKCLKTLKNQPNHYLTQPDPRKIKLKEPFHHWRTRKPPVLFCYSRFKKVDRVSDLQRLVSSTGRWPTSKSESRHEGIVHCHFNGSTTRDTLLCCNSWSWPFRLFLFFLLISFHLSPIE